MKSSSIKYYPSNGGFSSRRFGEHLRELIEAQQRAQHKRGTVFVCIGSDRSTGDSLGPLVGHKLKRSRRFSSAVLGDLERPVHAINLGETGRYLCRCYPDHVVVAVDAAIGRKEHVGYITMTEGPLYPGMGVSKRLGGIGDVSITGIVGWGDCMEPLMLQNTRLSLVMGMADCICGGILCGEYLARCDSGRNKGQFEERFSAFGYSI